MRPCLRLNDAAFRCLEVSGFKRVTVQDSKKRNGIKSDQRCETYQTWLCSSPKASIKTANSYSFSSFSIWNVYSIIIIIFKIWPEDSNCSHAINYFQTKALENFRNTALAIKAGPLPHFTPARLIIFFADKFISLAPCLLKLKSSTLLKDTQCVQLHILTGLPWWPGKYLNIPQFGND